MRSIVIADRNQSVQNELSRFLAGINWSVTGTSGEGADAVVKVLDLKPDVVLLSFDIPCLSGTEVAAILKNIMPQVHVIVYAVVKLPTCIAPQNEIDLVIPRTEGLNGLFAGVRNLIQPT